MRADWKQKAVIDKDIAACIMGVSFEAYGFLILIDVHEVAEDYNTGQERWIKAVSPDTKATRKEDLPAGSMGSF